MRLKDIYQKSKKPAISFEIFPPKGERVEEKIDALFEELTILSKFKPSYISVTYGAGGSTRQKTLELVKRIKKDLNVCPIPHFTCVGLSRPEISSYLKNIQELGINNILALRGDPPKGEEKFIKPKDGFGYANELVEYIKSSTNLNIAVAGYPEKHQECTCLDEDILNLKRKVNAGASVILTQLFYDNKFFFEYLEKTKQAGIDIPIVPGILPISSYKQIERIISLSGCKVPDSLMEKLEKYKDNKDDIKKIGAEYAVKQCSELIDSKAPGLHIYTLNKSEATSVILDALNL